MPTYSKPVRGYCYFCDEMKLTWDNEWVLYWYCPDCGKRVHRPTAKKKLLESINSKTKRIT